MNQLKNILLAVFFTTALVSSHDASAIELERVESMSRADANYCGDINAIATFKIKNLEEDDLQWGEFTLTKKNLAVITQAIRETYELSEANLNFAITSRYNSAVDNLIRDLALGTNSEENTHYLMSCYPLFVVNFFNLKVENNKLVLNQENNLKSYYTIGGGSDWDFSEYSVNLFIDMEKKTLKLFLIW